MPCIFHPQEIVYCKVSPFIIGVSLFPYYVCRNKELEWHYYDPKAGFCSNFHYVSSNPALKDVVSQAP